MRAPTGGPMSFQQVVEFLKRHYASGTHSERFNHHAKVVHRDGSVFAFAHAFVDRVYLQDKTWIVLYTEHFGMHVFESDEILKYREYSIVDPGEVHFMIN